MRAAGEYEGQSALHRTKGAMIAQVGDSTFEQEVLSSAIPVLVCFYAKDCAPWAAMAWPLQQAAWEMQAVARIVKLDVESSPSVRARFAIHGLPTLILFKDGEIAARRVGAVDRHEELVGWLMAGAQR